MTVWRPTETLNEGREKFFTLQSVLVCRSVCLGGGVTDSISSGGSRQKALWVSKESHFKLSIKENRWHLLEDGGINHSECSRVYTGNAVTLEPSWGLIIGDHFLSMRELIISQPLHFIQFGCSCFQLPIAFSGLVKIQPYYRVYSHHNILPRILRTPLLFTASTQFHYSKAPHSFVCKSHILPDISVPLLSSDLIMIFSKFEISWRSRQNKGLQPC